MVSSGLIAISYGPFGLTRCRFEQRDPVARNGERYPERLIDVVDFGRQSGRKGSPSRSVMGFIQVPSRSIFQTTVDWRGRSRTGDHWTRSDDFHTGRSDVTTIISGPPVVPVM